MKKIFKWKDISNSNHSEPTIFQGEKSCGFCKLKKIKEVINNLKVKKKKLNMSLLYDDNNKVQMSMDVVCFNGIYDINGQKGPNTVGKDIGFVGSFYNSYETKSSAVLPYDKDIQINSLPEETDKLNLVVNYCNNLPEQNNWVLPDVNEASLLFLNQQIVRGKTVDWLWFYTRTTLSDKSIYFYMITFGTGRRGSSNRTFIADDRYIRCVRTSTIK